MSTTRLQELYARAMARRSEAAGACVAPEDLLALVRRDGPEEHRLQVLDHVMNCEACHREFNLLRALEAAGAGTKPSTKVLRLSRRLTPLALAASLLLAIGIGLMVRNKAEIGDVVRGSHGITVVAPPAEIAPGQPIAFVWRQVAGAQRYRLEILDRNGTTVVSELTADTTLSLPSNQLQPGSEYRWWVRDATPGAQLGSDLRPLRVRIR